MRVRFPSLTLITPVVAAAALAGFGQQALATQITFVQAPQNRPQPQNQQGLPPEKKRSLSRYGPEDVFPGANEQEENRARESRPQRKSQPAPAARQTRAPKQSATPAATPSPTPSVTPSLTPDQPAVAAPSQAATPDQSVVATPSPAIVVAAFDNQGRRPPLAQFLKAISKWTVPILSGLALIVSVALVYMLAKLREKIREGGSG